jgi:hypothetical protein
MDLAALFASAFLAATILPFASEVPLAILVRQHEAIWLPVMVATAGNFLGVHHVPARPSDRIAVAADTSRNGPVALRRSRAPVVVAPVDRRRHVALAGATAIRFSPFAV